MVTTRLPARQVQKTRHMKLGTPFHMLRLTACQQNIFQLAPIIEGSYPLQAASWNRGEQDLCSPTQMEGKSFKLSVASLEPFGTPNEASGWEARLRNAPYFGPKNMWTNLKARTSPLPQRRD